MRSFDDALERLITDPGFATALAADPGRALAGYALSPDEAALLRSQVATGTDGGVPSAVEARTNQSSVFGLFTMDGFGDAPGASTGLGGAPGAGAGFGGAPGGSAGLGDAPGAGAGFGSAPRGFSITGHGATAGFGEAPPAVPDGYRTRVDADGDGFWDAHTVRGRADGGVEILVDRDGDGRADFTGHDVDADGLVDHADHDADGDGTADERLTDIDGDGWLDSPR